MINESYEDYLKYIDRKLFFIIICLIVLVLAIIYSITVGSSNISVIDIISNIVHYKETSIIVWNIRLPRALTAVIAGMGLAISGCVMQSILRNPLASQYTLGISHAAAFGAAFSIVILGAGSLQNNIKDAVSLNNPYIVTFSAFSWSILVVFLIILITKFKGNSPEVMILSGVAIGSLFTAGLMGLQYFASDVQIASIVFWTFGDIGKTTWEYFMIMTAVILPSMVYFMLNRWNYNALEAGEEVANSLGVNVEKVRLYGLIVSSFITSLIISFLGIIGFIGLICPHIARRVSGNDHRFLIPLSGLVGGVLLLISDTLARTIISPIVLPVGILTSFMGAPLFIYILIRGYYI